MESADPSDVDVLDDLLHDVDGEGEDFEDAEAYFDTDADQDGEGGGDATMDNILSQLDAVTTLDEDETQADISEEFHDSTSVPFSPMPANDADKNTETISHSPIDGNGKELNNDPISQESKQSEQPSSLSGEDVVEAVLDLAKNAHLNEELTLPATNELEATIPTQEQEPPPPKSVENEEERSSGEMETDTEVLGGIPAHDVERDTSVNDTVVMAAPTIDSDADYKIETLDMPLAPLVHDTASEDNEKASDLAAVPPPAPTAVPLIVGSMNPVEDDNDDSDESQGEEDVESTILPPPLQLGNPDDEDEDVLEVNSAVVSSIQIEEKQRLPMRAQSTEQQPQAMKTVDDASTDEDSALLNALPNSKVDGTSAIDLSFGEEVRVAHVTTLEPGSPFSDIHKIAGGSRSSQLSVDATFGISYQSLRKKGDKGDELLVDEKKGSYSLPSGPAFPDEREFENEIELTSDLSFSVAGNTSPSKDDESSAHADDDEFSFDIEPAKSSTLSEDILKARRESLEAKKRKEEKELMEELKRATDEEKRVLENNKMTETVQADSTTAAAAAAADSDALSLSELHSMYKRGLGDQEVLMDEENKKGEGRQAPEVGRSMSVMGRIFSQTHGATDTIAEEVNGDDTDGEDNDRNVESPKADDENAEDTKTITEKSEADQAEWREIKLVQHRQSQEGEESGSVKAGNGPDAASVSRTSYAEAAGYYAETPDVMQHRDIIVSEDFPRASCLTCLSRPRLTFAGAIEERDRVFCIAATAFDAHNDVVVGVLQTIYKKITKSSRDVLLIGRHWEDIGFQGTDPSTDLRGCGVLSLLQILYLVESYPDLAHRFHALSQHPTRHFPFACVLINVTLQCVVALRSGVLYPECNKHASVLTGMNRLYVALASQLHDMIQSRTDEIPLIMKDVLDRGRSNPSKIIDEAFDGTALRPSRPAAAPSKTKTKTAERKESDNNLEFTEIGLQSVDEE
ncbi:hypothetical protein KRP22_002935 [Phytophthora ramorum]|nr:ELMO domain-containing protein 3 [Phytophthora ramorum]KAH7503531.1 ELMO domain-containing protein 3 [Phytophthora ramorum]